MPLLELKSGTLLGAQADGTYRYQVQRMLGSGGFGITYLAMDAKLQGYVVIKELACDAVSHREADGNTVRASGGRDDLQRRLKEKFLNEARLLHRLRSPHIVRVTDVFEEFGTVYYAMDHIEARGALGTPRFDGPMQSPGALERLQQFEQLLAALDEVHRAGLIHGDVKPDNVLLDARVGAVLIDFGAARAEIDVSRGATSTMFTPGYAPPELMHRSRVSSAGPWSDLYSWGVMAYGAFAPHPTGHEPADAYVREHGQDPYGAIAPTLQRRGFSPSWAMAVAMCMETDPRRRPPSAQELLALLRQTHPVTLGGPLSPGPAPLPRTVLDDGFSGAPPRVLTGGVPSTVFDNRPAPGSVPSGWSSPPPQIPAASGSVSAAPETAQAGRGRGLALPVGVATAVLLAILGGWVWNKMNASGSMELKPVVEGEPGGVSSTIPRLAVAEGSVAEVPTPGAAPSPALHPGAAPGQLPTWPNNLGSASDGSDLAEGVFDSRNYWIYRVTRTADAPDRDEMSPLVYFSRAVPHSEMDFESGTFSYVRHGGWGEPDERALRAGLDEGVFLMTFQEGGSGLLDGSAGIRSYEQGGVEYQVYMGDLTDGTSRYGTRVRTTYIDPRVGIVHERYRDELQGFGRNLRVELVGARVGGVIWGDTNTGTPSCWNQDAVFRAQGLIENEFAMTADNYDGLNVDRSSGFRSISFSQYSGVVTMYGDGAPLRAFGQSRFYAAKAVDTPEGQVVVVELDTAQNQVEFHWLLLRGGQIARQNAITTPFQRGERYGIFHIPYQRECVYEIRGFSADERRVRVARLRDTSEGLMHVEGTLPYSALQ